MAYTFGWEPLQQYLIRFPGGRMQASRWPGTYREKRWFYLYPGQEIPPSDWLHWTRNAQNWNGMCAECHSTNLREGLRPEDDTYNTTWSEMDVGCEACHGPGSRHVAWAEVPAMGRPRVDELRPRDEDLGHAPAASWSSCARRATRGGPSSATTTTGGELLDNHLPVLLSEGTYHPDGQILDEDFEYGSLRPEQDVPRWASAASTATTPTPLKLHKEGNGVCLQCHRRRAYDDARHHFHKKEWKGRPSDGALCVSCHMPGLPSWSSTGGPTTPSASRGRT